MSGKKLPEFVLFGDSLTEWGFEEETRGWGWVLEQEYDGKARIENEGVAGYTSSMLERNFRRIIERATLPDAAPTLLITIWLGANDACVGTGAHVPLPKFEDNIRSFVDQVLAEEQLRDTKVVLITPPPINIPDAEPEDDGMDLGPAAAAAMKAFDPKKSRSYIVYKSKRTYGEKIMEIAASYAETGRVVGLDYWKALIDAGLDDQHRLGDEDAYHEDMLPGSGLPWAKAFKQGYFSDGLHLEGLAYDVLSKAVVELIQTKWPALTPERIGTA
ncbi:SGNH hydrolase-type esterase domain-containing protein [Lophiotrema nucula]|uniref:SGNH hydrolase-type esterase domain-containing protein n=1 Tax=Lophiotrema nucula TaxID=690887 RepID=A0A6A5ZTH8_9PLEO|nr:SGNH hydrolase-type esterase domain-containing protein [Lophiotrema nucula]